MPDNIQEHTKRMLELLNQYKYYKERKEKFLDEIKNIGNLPKGESILRKKEFLRGKSKDFWIKNYNKNMLEVLKHIENENQNIVDMVELESFLAAPEKIQKKLKEEVSKKEDVIPIPSRKGEVEYAKLSKKEIKRLLSEINTTSLEIKEFIKKYEKSKKEKGVVKEEYSIYKPSQTGAIANSFLGSYSILLTKKYPELFKPLEKSLKQVDIKILPKTYISVSLFFTILAFPIFWIVTGIAFFSIIKGFILGIIGAILTFVCFYYYPASLIGGRRKKIKNDLPFALVHMSAISGSGAKPIDIFSLLESSGEYRELGKEINKIMNYVNLFGYDLTTALRNVAQTTPSPGFKEVLNGMVSTIESGGDLDEYLKGKADEALNTYKLERRKYVETLATYSDIYTAILIAAPLLFIIVLAIINAIGGKISGLDMRTIALLGTYGLVPLLNIGYIVFLTASQPEL